MTEEVLAVFEKSCKQCHGPDGHGITAVAPDLRLSPQRSEEEWEKYLRDPQSVVPNTKKQPMRGLSDDDVKAVAIYLHDLTQHNPPPQK